MQSTSSWLSLTGSVMSTVWTGYFWFMKARRERPNLKAHLADREWYLGNCDEKTRQIGLNLGIIVANYSTLPDSVVGVRMWLKTQSGAWLPFENTSFDPKTPQPFNMPSLQTSLLRVRGFVTFQSSPELESGRVLQQYVDKFFTEPREVRVELRGLSERRHTHDLRYSSTDK